MGGSCAGLSVKQSPRSSGLPATLQTPVQWAWAPRGRGPITSQPLIPTGRGGHTSPPSAIALTSVLICGPPMPLRSWESAHQPPCGATVRREWPSSPAWAQFLGVLRIRGSRPPPQAHCSVLPSVLPALSSWTSGPGPSSSSWIHGELWGTGPG